MQVSSLNKVKIIRKKVSLRLNIRLLERDEWILLDKDHRQ